MKSVILKTKNNDGDRCKTYIYDYNNSLIFHKFTLVDKSKGFASMFGGETLAKETDNYIITFHRFSIKKSTLSTALKQLGVEL